MCRHMGLLVCFACLAFSSPSSCSDEVFEEKISCDIKNLYDKYSINSTLTLQSFEQFIETVKDICSSNCIHGKKHGLQTELPPSSQSGTIQKKSDEQDLPVNNVSQHTWNPNVWLFAGLSVLFISACGLGAVAVIPILPSQLFQPAIQFLVALAVGSLTGDAILHLIPHAFRTEAVAQVHCHSNSSDDRLCQSFTDRGHQNHDHKHNTVVVWKGFVVLLVLTLFFVIERLLNMFGEWRCQRQSSKQVAQVAQLLSDSSKMVGEKLCRHHQHSHQGHKSHSRKINYTADENTELSRRLTEDCADTGGSPNADLLVSCVSREKEISGSPVCLNNEDTACSGTMTQEKCSKQSGSDSGCSEWEGLLVGNPLIYCKSHEICDGSAAKIEATRIPELKKRSNRESDHIVTIKSSALPMESSTGNEEEGRESLTVFISEHHTSHHGHSHSHGHIHAQSKDIGSLAWLVLAGDGLHNLSDGLAIGAAFAANVIGGFTTALAVLCHELPHELGDFAVLLKAGMTIKQAIICNLLSSLLCLLGVLIGLAVGSAQQTAPWIFAATAGMFLYIALVDMVPELNGPVGNRSSAFIQLLLQLAGLLVGFSIMLAIALYEHEISQMLQS